MFAVLVKYHFVYLLGSLSIYLSRTVLSGGVCVTSQSSWQSVILCNVFELRYLMV